MKEAFKMKNTTYDFLKWCCMFFLPALAIFVQAVGSIWAIPYADGISQTIVALNALLAGCLGISNMQYIAEKEGTPDEQ